MSRHSAQLGHDKALGWGAGRVQGVQAAGWALGVLALSAQAGSAGEAAGHAGRALGAARYGRCRQRAPGCAEQAAAGARGARQAGSRRGACAGRVAGGAQTLGAGGARCKRAAWVLGEQPGRASWPWAVHSVHSAYFQSVLTRYCS